MNDKKCYVFLTHVCFCIYIILCSTAVSKRFIHLGIGVRWWPRNVHRLLVTAVFTSSASTAVGVVATTVFVRYTILWNSLYKDDAENKLRGWRKITTNGRHCDRRSNFKSLERKKRVLTNKAGFDDALFSSSRRTPKAIFLKLPH